MTSVSERQSNRQLKGEENRVQPLYQVVARGQVLCFVADGSFLILRGTKGVPRKGVWTSVDMSVWTCNELRANHDQTCCYLRPPFLGAPLVPSGLTALMLHSVSSVMLLWSHTALLGTYVLYMMFSSRFVSGVCEKTFLLRRKPFGA